ncbi:hypothetical protein Tco_1483468 [Tanacetum coccineum]
MGDKHLDTQKGSLESSVKDPILIPSESDSSVEDLVPTPSESADLSDGESECDVPVNDESSPTFATFSNPLFDSNDDFTSSDDESLSDEDIDDYDSEGDIHFLEELLSNDSFPLPEDESFSLDHFDDPSLPRPPPEPSDVEICFNFKPYAGVVTKESECDISDDADSYS